MNKYIGKITDVFQLQNRLVVQLDLLYDDFASQYESGEMLELRRQDGTSIRTQSWTEMFAPTNLGRPACLSLQKHVSKTDLPLGTEVWINRTEERGQRHTS